MTDLFIWGFADSFQPTVVASCASVRRHASDVVCGRRITWGVCVKLKAMATRATVHMRRSPRSMLAYIHQDSGAFFLFVSRHNSAQSGSTANNPVHEGHRVQVIITRWVLITDLSRTLLVGGVSCDPWRQEFPLHFCKVWLQKCKNLVSSPPATSVYLLFRFM